VGAVKKLLPAVVIVALCLSCAPPFDLGYSSAAVILSRMTKEGQPGPITNYWPDTYSPAPVFYPEKTSTGIDATRGFFLTTDVGDTVEFFGFMAPDGLGGYTSYTQGMASLYHQDLNYPTFTAVSVKAGDYVAVIGLDSQNPSNNSLVVGQAVGGPSFFTPISVVTFSVLGGFGSPPQVIGASIFPSVSAFDTLYFLARDTSSGSFYEGTSTVDSTGVSGSYAYVYSGFAESLPFIPSTNRVMYFHDPSANVSYASFFAGGSWQCWKWWLNAGVITWVQLSGVSWRVDAVLTTGELVSTQDGIGRVYDSNGSQLTSFPLGNLRLAYEEYVNGTPRVFFSLPIQQDNGRISFALYSITSSQLDSLKY
jgi:hypothetical protein